MKTIAMYLPQFHEVEENNEWWGNGYTEWTAVKKATPLFHGHKQPKAPFNDNYYNLLDKQTMITQAKLAEEYGIDGFCFYHYYFKNGRKILEKPAENLLKWKDINMPYCFCWANETWARTWSNISGANAWGSKFENKKQKAGSGILLEQRYGQEKEWEEHLEYLIPFFKDERYIKYNGQPILLIYKPEDISCLYKMIDTWNEILQRKYGAKLYVIGVNVNYKYPGIDAVLYLGPGAYENSELTGKVVSFVKKNGVNTIDADEIYDIARESKSAEGCSTIFSAITGYDDTPRRGMSGICCTGITPEKFKHHLATIMRKNMEMGNEYTFVNAWNEWGEGMYLEPDKESEFKYLKMVKQAKEEYILNKYEVCNNELTHGVCVNNKYRLQSILLKKWIQMKIKGFTIKEYLKKNSMTNIAIYGWGDIAKILYEDIFCGEISIDYIIDTNVCGEGIVSVEKFKLMEKKIDLIIITPILGIKEIYNQLKPMVDCKIFSMMELIDNASERGK